jgi:hypothetical protein
MSTIEENVMEIVGVDRVLSLVGGHAHLLLGDLLTANAIPRPESACCSEGGWCVLVFTVPTRPGEGLEGLTRTERDCLAVLGVEDAPLSAERLCDKLEAAKLGPYSLSTVKRALKQLKRLGLIANQRRGQRGYYLPERLPLLRRLAQ